MTPVLLGTLSISGLFAGFVHVLAGPDHLAAIAPYAVNAKARAWRTGVRWGLGHSAGVLGIGLLALLLRDTLSIDLVSAWSERFVGMVLVGIGIWGLRAALAYGTDTHLHRRDGQSHGHAHEHPAFAVGTVHGLAGSSHLFGVVPALACPRIPQQQPIFFCSVSGALLQWGPSRHSSAGSQGGCRRAVPKRKTRCWVYFP